MSPAPEPERNQYEDIDDKDPTDFAEIRVLATPAERPAEPIVDPSTTFWYDVKNLTPGSLPSTTAIGVTVGVVCGILAYVYYTILFFLLHFLWHDLPEMIVDKWNISESLYWLWIPIVGMTNALLVGLSVRFLGEPGDLSYTVQCVHDEAYISMGHVMPMMAASQFSILGGGSLGPEAPLVAICAAFAGFISRSIYGQTSMNLIRKHTLMGMASALAAFFGVPLGGSLFALEINNRFGIEYYEHTMDAIFSGTVCLVVFRGLAQLEIGPVWEFSETTLGPSSPATVGVGALLGLLGAGAAACFVFFHKYVISLFKKWGLLDNAFAVQRALLGASVMLAIGVLIPHTMFWGELEIPMIATAASASELPNVFPTSGLIGFEMNSFWTAMVVGVAKMVAISFTVAAGYRGGFIFPFFAAGSAFGKALTYLIPSLSPTLAALCFAAGINVAITRTALASTIILCGLAGEINAGPPILAASMISLFVTKYMPFIRSQAERTDISRNTQKVITGPGTLRERLFSNSTSGSATASAVGTPDISVGYGSNQATPLVAEGRKRSSSIDYA